MSNNMPSYSQLTPSSSIVPSKAGLMNGSSLPQHMGVTPSFETIIIDSRVLTTCNILALHFELPTILILLIQTLVFHLILLRNACFDFEQKRHLRMWSHISIA
ncbi:hypothetical protein EB796_016421 [Bugula neritina]|uniref:Uncharacterized protein n=1 Tax=Bugula neritina TaxID=10212 RepID=A0A7J7JGP8_BUGNE|nr:hypothetical protein EB796_016421 [Bugula neritina]